MTGWNNELLQIGPFTVYGYGLMIAIGVIAAYLIGEYRAKKQGIDPDELFWLTISCLVGGILGAKLLFYIVEFKAILADPSILLDVTHGFVVYGGIIGGIFTGYMFCRIRKREKFLQMFDLVMPSIAVAQGFGRIGCTFAGCCYGKETDSAFHIIYEASEFAPNGTPLIPTQPIMAALNFIHFFLLILIAKKVKSAGQVGGFYLVFYSIGRFFLEYLRNDPRGSVTYFSTSQFISLFILAAGVAVIVLCGKLGGPKAALVENVTKKETDNEEIQ